MRSISLKFSILTLLVSTVVVAAVAVCYKSVFIFPVDPLARVDSWELVRYSGGHIVAKVSVRKEAKFQEWIAKNAECNWALCVDTYSPSTLLRSESFQFTFTQKSVIFDNGGVRLFRSRCNFDDKFELFCKSLVSLEKNQTGENKGDADKGDAAH